MIEQAYASGILAYEKIRVNVHAGVVCHVLAGVTSSVGQSPKHRYCIVDAQDYQCDLVL